MDALLTGSGGTRLRWDQLPERIRDEVQRRLGDRVVAAHVQHGGFSPAFAGRLRLAGGGRVFVKAGSAAHDAHIGTAFRHEARVVAGLPEHAPAPRLRWWFDDGDWVVLAFDEATGAPPALPWRRTDRDRVLAALTALAADLTPAPKVPVPDLDDENAFPLDGFRTLAAGPTEQLAAPATEPLAAAPTEPLAAAPTEPLAAAPTEPLAAAPTEPLAAAPTEPLAAAPTEPLAAAPTERLAAGYPWVAAELATLASWEARWPEVAGGDTLLHGDLRADNLLLTDERVLFVDWPGAVRGVAWFDLVAFLPSLMMQGGGDGARILATHPLTAGVEPAALTAGLVAITGYFVSQSLLPAPTRLPRIREFQRAQALSAIDLLRTRL
ncbi:hypothetical protein Athai_42520 [Actinocatenispora thailandica]|uniref:Aminoglycoside phosphotransferase n=1 Tax=Actinocatenispora thailandica TaxID=227318 RepID=A0A7R7DS00_9ACTN|nr:phosphotransferase [Actinocatenispora thailandica]BCJ36749.1 hypothetical protein Athai_42520 [Actinocatenispora thailandica]